MGNDPLYFEEHRDDDHWDDTFSVIVDRMPDGEIWSTLGFQYDTVNMDRAAWEHLKQMCERALATLDQIEEKA